MATHLIIFSIILFLILHTYVFYPIILRLIARFKKPDYAEYTREEALPFVTVILSVHNEEKIIEEKIHSTFNTDYPIDKLRMIVGADDCADQTLPILEKLQQQYPQLILQKYHRIGKGNVFNHIMAHLNPRKEEIIVCTDANVFFKEDTLFHLIKKMKTPEIGLIGAWVVNENTRSEMAQQEQIYIQSENKIKYNEGKLAGNMIGAFGACYAMKAELYSEIPPNFITDDFFLSLKVLERGYQCILEIDALCFERVTPSLWSEFKRKKRYAAGNFQNFLFNYLKGIKTNVWKPTERI
ncbi:MAG: glycosyltransferase [Bacteroidetes bacterium]|nr:glycosyltransferase [Bacteroidota bacterium]